MKITATLFQLDALRGMLRDITAPAEGELGEREEAAREALDEARKPLYGQHRAEWLRTNNSMDKRDPRFVAEIEIADEILTLAFDRAHLAYQDRLDRVLDGVDAEARELQTADASSLDVSRETEAMIQARRRDAVANLIASVNSAHATMTAISDLKKA